MAFMVKLLGKNVLDIIRHLFIMNEKLFSHVIAEKNIFCILIKCFVIPGGLGVCKYPLEWKFQGGWGV